MKKLLRLLLILLTLIPVGCVPALTNPATNAATDSATRPSPAATRVVALTPITADIIHRLAPTRLVGMSGSQLLNQNETFKAIPRVSQGRTQPNLEKIVSLTR